MPDQASQPSQEKSDLARQEENAVAELREPVSAERLLQGLQAWRLPPDKQLAYLDRSLAELREKTRAFVDRCMQGKFPLA